MRETVVMDEPREKTGRTAVLFMDEKVHGNHLDRDFCIGLQRLSAPLGVDDIIPVVGVHAVSIINKASGLAATIPQLPNGTQSLSGCVLIESVGQYSSTYAAPTVDDLMRLIEFRNQPVKS